MKLAISFVLVVLLAACGKSEPDVPTDAALIGTWRFVGIESGNHFTPMDAAGSEFTLDADGMLRDAKGNVSTGRWSRVGDEVVVRFEGKPALADIRYRYRRGDLVLKLKEYASAVHRKK